MWTSTIQALKKCSAIKIVKGKLGWQWGQMKSLKSLLVSPKKTFPTSTLHNCKRFLQRILKDPKGMNETEVDVAHLGRNGHGDTYLHSLIIRSMHVIKKTPLSQLLINYTTCLTFQLNI